MVRIFSAVLLAFIATVGLFVLMDQLIKSGDNELDESGSRKIADFLMPDRQIENNLKEELPDKPETPEPPPPDLPQDQVLNPDQVDVAVSIPTPDVRVDLSGGFGGLSASDGEYLPIFRTEPRYPRRAQSRGIEGYVVVEFTVTKVGSVKDVVVVEAQPKNIFDNAAKQAVLKWKFKPRVVDGEAIEVPGVMNKVTFAMEK